MEPGRFYIWVMGKIGVFILGVIAGFILLPILIINACT
jgi:hypothetical protein